MVTMKKEWGRGQIPLRSYKKPHIFSVAAAAPVGLPEIQPGPIGRTDHLDVGAVAKDALLQTEVSEGRIQVTRQEGNVTGNEGGPSTGQAGGQELRLLGGQRHVVQERQETKELLEEVGIGIEGVRSGTVRSGVRSPGEGHGGQRRMQKNAEEGRSGRA